MHPLSRIPFIPCLAGIGLVLSWSAALPEAEPARVPLRILVTNDDGIDAPGLLAVVAELSTIAEIIVCAPDSNRSGSSASTDALAERMSIEARTISGASNAYAVGGKPVDAAQFGLFQLGPTQDPSDFDLVVSGINNGPNVGNVSIYSGTVGAATAAAHYGVPAVAVSQVSGQTSYALAAEATRRFVEELCQQGATPGIVYSINVPTAQAAQVAGVSVSAQGGDYFRVQEFRIFTDQQGDQTAQARLGSGGTAPTGTDTAAYQQKFVTVTPLSIDRTDAAVLADMQNWNF